MDSNSGILSENTKANYTERYDLLLKMKNHVNLHIEFSCLLNNFRLFLKTKAALLLGAESEVSPVTHTQYA